MDKKDDIVQTSIIFPTYNEALNIEELINRTHSSLPNNKEIIVVDDDSPDKTWEIAKNIENKNVKVIRRINQRKLVSAIQRGINEAKGENIIWMDADLSMPPEIISKMVEHLSRYDVVVGSRYAKGGKDKRPLLRIISSRFINLIANLVLNFKVLDYDSGFIAAKKEVLKKIPLSDSGYGEYCIEFLFKVGNEGFKIKEIPYSFVDRKAGESKTAESLYGLFKFGMMYLKKIILLRLKI